MTGDQYLILHKVRGEPAFDIAQRMRCPTCGGVGSHGNPDFETGIVSDYEGAPHDECNGLGYWWIIPTSGHRAYPIWYSELENYAVAGMTAAQALESMQEQLAALPDHYPILRAPHEPLATGSLAERLGLVPKVEIPVIKRRV